MPRPSILLEHPNNIWSKYHEAPRYSVFASILLLPLRPKHLPQHPLLDNPQKQGAEGDF
jgi:hypothetical protein